MPGFDDFQYYFVLDVLNVSKFEYGIGTLMAGIVVFVGPIIFQKYCRDTDYRIIFFRAQILHIIQSIFCLMLALRVFKYFGVPEVLIFWATGSLMEAIERMMSLVPSFIIMGKIIPPGVEGTMISLTATIININ